MARRKNYPGHIRERGGACLVRLRVEGEPHTFTVRGPRKEAERRAREEYQRLMSEAERRRDGLPGVTYFSGLLGRFEEQYVPGLAPGTRASYEDSLKPIGHYFLVELGDPALPRIHARHVKSYLSWRRLRNVDGTKRVEPLSNRTLQKDRAVLHRLFSIAEKMELREGNPVGRVEAPKARERDPVLLTDTEYERLLEACSGDPMLQLYALTLGETGVRCLSEALWVRWEDVDLQEGFLWIDSTQHGRRTKSGKGRWIPMTPRLREAFRDHFAQFRLVSYDGERTPWVFHHLRHVRGKRAGERVKRNLREKLGEAARRAELPDGWVAHDLRHRRVTSWLARGANPVHVKEALGHSDLRTTMRYTHLAREHLRSLVVEEPERPAREELKEGLGG